MESHRELSWGPWLCEMSKKLKSNINQSLMNTIDQKNTKKLVIKSFKGGLHSLIKVKPKLPDNYIQTTCQKLTDAVQAIYANRSISESLESLYKVISIYNDRIVRTCVITERQKCSTIP